MWSSKCLRGDVRSIVHHHPPSTVHHSPSTITTTIHHQPPHVGNQWIQSWPWCIWVGSPKRSDLRRHLWPLPWHMELQNSGQAIDAVPWWTAGCTGWSCSAVSAWETHQQRLVVKKMWLVVQCFFSTIYLGMVIVLNWLIFVGWVIVIACYSQPEIMMDDGWWEQKPMLLALHVSMICWEECVRCWYAQYHRTGPTLPMLSMSCSVNIWWFTPPKCRCLSSGALHSHTDGGVNHFFGSSIFGMIGWLTSFFTGLKPPTRSVSSLSC